MPSETLPFTYIYWEGKLRHIPQTVSFETLKYFVQDNEKSIKPLANVIMTSLKKRGELQKMIEEKDMSIYDFLRHITTDDANVNVKFAETIFYGIYGTSIRNISVQLALFKKHLKFFKLGTVPKDLMPKCREYFPIFFLDKSYRFSEGLSMLPNAMNAHLKKNPQFDLKLNTVFDEIDLDKKEIVCRNERITYDNLIMTIPTHQLKSAIRKVSTKNPDK